jgi:amidase
MNDDETLGYLTISETVSRLAAGKATSTELLQSLLRRIRALNPRLNAFALVDEAGALERARASDERRSAGLAIGPLDGIPITVKDNYETAGILCRAGSPRFKDHLPTADAEMARRLKAAGAVIIGKTNLPPLAMDVQTNSPLTGRTNNPWDAERTCGGSSGGGATAVAAGLSCADLCNDLLGSIRVPSHYCGVYGYMPTEYCLPLDGILPRLRENGAFGSTISRILRPGFIARSVGDVELLLSIVGGASEREPLMHPFPLPRAEVGGTRKPRLAFMPTIGTLPIDEEYAREMKAYIGALKDSGFDVAELAPGTIESRAVKECFNRLVFGAQAAAMPGPVRLFMKIAMGDMRLFSLDMRRYLEAESERAARIFAWEEATRGYDAVLLPVSSTGAFSHRKTGSKIDVNGAPTDYSTATIGLTFAFNVLGCPVLSLPMGRTGSGLPLGIQAVGRRYQDFTLLALATELDRVGIGFRKPPLG